MTPLRRACAALLLVALVAGTAACTAGGAPPSDVAWYPSAGDGGFEGLMEGTLVLEDGCTYVDSDEGRWLPIFADDVSAKDGVLRYGSQTFTYDEAVRLGGGTSEVADTDTVPAACDDDLPVWRVSQP